VRLLAFVVRPEETRETRVDSRRLFLSTLDDLQSRLQDPDDEYRMLRAAGLVRMLHIAAATQIRLDTPGRAYYRRKLAAGKTRMEAMRCLKRRISDAVYRQLLADAHANTHEEVGTGPGGHCGASQESSAVDLPPQIDTSDQPLPGPATPTLQPTPRPRKTSTRKLSQTAG
jgi:hypothetical protein